MRKPFLVAIAGLAIAGCGPADDGGSGVDAGVSALCQIQGASEPFPGYPFEYQTFKDTIYPALVSDCGSSGCHGAPTGQGGYNVFGDGDTCPDAQSFNAFKAYSDYASASAASGSRMVAAVDGTLPAHVAKDALIPTFTDFVEKGIARYQEDSGGGKQPPYNYFDAGEYASKIQPMLEGCLVGGACHGVDSGSGRVYLATANAAAGTAELTDNIKAVVALVDINKTAIDSTFYKKSTDGHLSLTVSDPATLEAWIQAGIDNIPPDNGGGGEPIGCEDPSRFNEGVFRDEIMPMLLGEVDYNDIDGNRTTVGCLRSECHALDRGPGKFYIDLTAPTSEQIEAFSCFVNLENPSRSQVLLCPLQEAGCVAPGTHPGEDVFADVQDLNYQKVVAYLYATANGATPLDFAFFARKINTIYNDENAVDDGNVGLTCASAGCHNSPFAGQVDNGSNFGIIPEAFQERELFLNYVQSANFTFFPQADQSSLFLYPTNEIANTDNPLATGIDHPGGLCFDVDSQFALDVLKFAGGIRPNADGFLQDMLVAGVFAASDIDQESISDEANMTPRIFERSGAGQQFNGGEWDGFFSNNNEIDFLEAFELEADEVDGVNAYAVAYVLNTEFRALKVRAQVNSENDIQLYFGNGEDQANNGNPAAVTFELPPFGGTEPAVTPIIVKLFKDAADQTFSFNIQFEDDNGNVLNDADKKLVFTLSAEQAGI